MGFEGLALALAAFLAAARGKEGRRYIYDQLEYAFDASKTMGEEGEAKERRRKVNSFPFLLPFPSLPLLLLPLVDPFVAQSIRAQTQD